MTFTVSEDDLTNALFYRSALYSDGNGNKAQARQQARLMLASEALLAMCKQLLASYDSGSDVERREAESTANQLVSVLERRL